MAQKTVVITGVSSGIGQAVASALAKDGWDVVGLMRKPAPAEGMRVYGVDLSDLAATARLAVRLAKDLKHVDAFIHVAGVWHDQQQALTDKTLAEFTPAQVVGTMNVGITAPMLLLGALLRRMTRGTVIGVSGTFSEGAGGWLPYYTSKRALEDFLVGLSQDAPTLYVFGISPADTATPAFAKFYPEYYNEAQPPEAVADLVRQLLGTKPPFKSGEVIELRAGKSRRGFHA